MAVVKRLILALVVMFMPLIMFVAGSAIVTSPAPATPMPTRRAVLAPCMDDPRLALHDFRIYFGVVADCTAIPSELRTAALSSVVASREERASILFAAARKDARFRSACDVDAAHAAEPLVDHPSFDACTKEIPALKLEAIGLSCKIDIGTYVFLDVLAARLRDDPDGPWTMTREARDVTSLIEQEPWLCPHAENIDAAVPRPKPAPVTRKGVVWPYHAWDRAEAVTFNPFGQRPSIQLYAYDDDGWSEHLALRKGITSAQASQAVDLLRSTQGGVEVSKCPFPRHAVVLYDGEVPVASINVCFECGDILVWPPWPGNEISAPGWEARHAYQLALHKQTFPKWKTFFKDEVGFAVQ